MTRRISLLSPAKLNLFLHVTGQREDGYHELQTLFQLLHWGDQITLELADAGGITLAQQLDGVLERDNLIIKAARRLTGHLTEEPNVVIHLEKNIPMGAGLGGVLQCGYSTPWAQHLAGARPKPR